jgi:shikimate dehydrogenase
MTDRYAVVGNPVAHSLSPAIHTAFARETGQDIEYVKLLAPLDAFTPTVAQFRAAGGKGVNVTVPFKFEALKLSALPSPEANEAQAANTLDFRDAKIRAYNTDGSGLVGDLARNLGFSIAGQRVLIMGAGGATNGVVHPVLRAAPALLVVCNRTLDKAVAVIERLRHVPEFSATGLAAKSYAALSGMQFDLVINATSAGLHNEMPPLPSKIFARGALAYEMVYGRKTAFMTFAQTQSARVVDGLGMLVEQAAAAFEIWRGVRPDSRAVLAELRRRDSRTGSEAQPCGSG